MVEHGDQDVPALAAAPVRTPAEHLAAADEQCRDMPLDPAHGRRGLHVAEFTVVTEVHFRGVVVQRPHTHDVVVEHRARRLEDSARIPFHAASPRGGVGARLDPANQRFR